MPKYTLLPQTVAAITSRHKTYWDKQRPELFRLKQCYETRMWDDRTGSDDRGFSSQAGINIEVPVGYETVETLMASLFTRQPGVVIRPGIQGNGSPDKAEALINNWTMRNRRVIEDAARLALIYPMSFVKLVPQDHPDPIRRVTAVAVPPWEVIIDRDAYRYDEQRFCGHIYYLPLPDAKAKFGNKRFEAGERAEYWDKSGMNSEMGYGGGGAKLGVGGYGSDEGEDGYFQFIKVVELYDFVNDKLLFWSPNYKSGDEFLDAGPIPFRRFDGSPDNNIIPMYFNHVPDKPLDGYSTLRRTYDQAFEMCIIRSFQANAVRKASRQWLVRKGTMDEEQMAQLISGVDGAYVEVETTDALSSVMMPVPHTSTPPEVQAYYEAVRSDKDRGSIMAPFTRGEATRSSATEIAALVAYTSSEVGRMARERDEMIELMSRGILNMYRVYLGEQPVTLLVKGKYLRVSGSDLYDDFNIYSQDNASTPVSDAIRKSELLGASNLLMAMGVPQQEMLKELVRTLNLPESFLQPAQPPPPEMMGPPGEGPLPSAGPAAAAALKGSGAGSPANLASAILDARR